MTGSEIGRESTKTLRYHLCLRCFRAVPATSNERYCINDGTHLLEACARCGATISSPYARFCAACGLEFASTTKAKEA